MCCCTLSVPFFYCWVLFCLLENNLNDSSVRIPSKVCTVKFAILCSLMADISFCKVFDKLSVSAYNLYPKDNPQKNENVRICTGDNPQISLFWPRFGSGFKCIVTKRKSAFLLTLTYYSEATVIPAGISSYFPESLFITAPF